MGLSRQFRALLRLAALWAIPWTAIGAALAVFRWVTSGDLPPTDQSLAAWIGLHAVAYGALGLISGLDVGLLLAHAERGRRVEELSPRRVALWSTIGGAGPAGVFALLAWGFGSPTIVYLPLLGLGLVSAAISGGLAVAGLAMAKRPPLPRPQDPPRLGAT